MQRSCPFWSSGLSMFDASTVAPWAAPAPRIVWISSMNTTGFSRSCTAATSALKRCSKSPRYFVPASSAPRSSAKISAPRRMSGHLALVDALGQALGERGLPDAALADEDRVVLAPARQDVHGAVDLGPSPHEGVQTPGRGRLGQIVRERGEGIGGHLLVLAEAATPRHRAIPIGAAVRARLRDPVRLVAEHVEPRDLVAAQQGHRVRVRLLEERRQQIARFHLFLLRGVGLGQRALDHPVEGEGLRRVVRPLPLVVLDLLVEEVGELGLEPTQIDADVAQDLGALVVVGQREQQMLHGQIGMPPRDGLTQRGLQGHLQFAIDVAQEVGSIPTGYSGSAPARRGCPRSSAMRWTVATFVSAISRVYTPAIPEPLRWIRSISAFDSAGLLRKTLSRTPTTKPMGV